MPTRLRLQDFADWTRYYREYQIRLATDYLLPCLRRWGRFSPGVRILDVGCGDGGAVIGLARAGARLSGLEIDPRRLHGARQQVEAEKLEVQLAVADVTDAKSLEVLGGPFDLILFRDVLEHIPRGGQALANCRALLADRGGIVVVFPPYYSPFGGHQQLLHPKARLGIPFARLPWAHCLPRNLFRSLARGDGGADDPQWEEIETIHAARLTLSSLRKTAKEARLRVARAHHYLLRPSFALRYGTPVLGAGILGAVPLLREVLVTGSYQYLEVDESSL